MAVQSLNPWIADLIQEELNAVLTWQTNKNNKIKVEPEDDLRFDNDGSNFRCTVSQTEPGRSEVQLIEVLGSPDTAGGVKVIVSDGHTRIRARLVGSVVDILEAELEESLGKESTNDVIRLKRFVIVSTPIGPAAEWIQLTIEEIDYLYHRRRNIGQPTPVEQDSDIRYLVTDRIPALLGSHSEEDEAQSEAEDMQSQEVQIEPATIAVERSSPASAPVLPIQQSPSEKGSARKRRQPLHTLADDGFEFRAGVNLEGPVKAQRKDAGNLLNLLHGKQPQAEVVAETPIRPSDRSRAIQGHGLFAGAAIGGAQEARDSPERMDVDDSPRQSQAEEDNEELPHDVTSSPPKPETPRPLAGHPEVSRPSSSRPNPPRPNSSRPSPRRLSPARATISRLSPERFGYPRVPQAAGAIEVAMPPTQPRSTRSTQVRSRLPHGRRKIPANQRALLNEETSWFPPLPGKRFPTPNVPIELLTKWNAAPSPSQKSKTKPGRESTSASPISRSQRASQRKAASPEPDEESSDSPSESSDDPDKELSLSQWPASPPQARVKSRPDLPPDSSIGEVVRGTPEYQLEVAPPRALKVSKPAPKAAAQSQQATDRHPLPKRPAVPIPEPTDEMLYSQRNTPVKASPRIHMASQRPASQRSQPSPRSQASPIVRSPPRSQVSPLAQPPVRSQPSSRSQPSPRVPQSPHSQRETHSINASHTQRPAQNSAPFPSYANRRNLDNNPYHTSSQGNSNSTPPRNTASNPTPPSKTNSNFPSTLPGFNPTSQPKPTHTSTPLRHPQESPPDRRNGTYHSSQPPVNSQPPRSFSQTTPVPPKEYNQRSRSEWRERNNRKQHAEEEERIADEKSNNKSKKAKKKNHDSGNDGEVIREFVASFINIRPGGAWAVSSSETPPASRSRGVDVLAWKL